MSTQDASQYLLVVIEGPATDDDARAVREALEPMLARRWFHVPPALVDEIDLSEPVRPGDVEPRNVGAALLLPAPSGDAHQEASCLDDAREFIHCMAGYALSSGHELSVDYRGETIGWIEPDGSYDDIRESLLDPWLQSVQTMS